MASTMGYGMGEYWLFLEYLNKRIEKHGVRIDQAVRSDNHTMKTICKSERAEAEVIRSEFLRMFKEYE